MRKKEYAYFLYVTIGCKAPNSETGVISVMLLTHSKWQTFTSREIPNSKKSAQMLLAVSKESKKDVDQMVSAGQAAGGKADPNKKQDLGFMYGRSLEDPDGHIWETFCMDMSAM